MVFSNNDYSDTNWSVLAFSAGTENPIRLIAFILRQFIEEGFTLRQFKDAGFIRRQFREQGFVQ